MVVFAVPEESKPFLRRVSPGLRRAGEREVQVLWPGQGPADPEGFCPTLRVLTTGMGVRNARAAFEGACHHAAPSLVLTCGFAGGLDPSLLNGAVLFDADEDFPLTDRLSAAGARPGRFHCSARVAVTVAEKAKLRQATGADAVEMESSVIRELCRTRRIPSATVRVISDSADEDLPLDFNALMTAEMKLHLGKLAWRLIRSPGRIPELIRFQKRVNRAADRLAETLGQVLS